jgi:uncharacterized protein
MIIDVHTHIYSLDHKTTFDRERMFRNLVNEAKENNVSHLLIIAGFRKIDRWDTSTNESLALARHTPHVLIIASLDIVKYTKQDLSNLERLLKLKRIVGIKIYTGYQHVYPADKRCLPIYRLCIKYDVPVVFHSGDTLAGYVGDPKIKYSHPMHIDEVATDFPDLKIVIAHMGNPWLIDCAEILYKNPNVYADISGLVVGDDLKTPYGDLMKQRTNELLTYVNSNKLLYGTDWPLCTMKAYLKFVNMLDISKEDKEKILYKNAQKVFNI